MRTPALVMTLATLVVAGCAPTGPSDAGRARQALLGRSLADIESCIGHGVRRTLADGRIAYTYDHGGPPTRGGLRIEGGSSGDVTIGAAITLPTGRGGLRSNDYCRAVIVFREDRVERVEYSGEPYRGYPDDIACSEIVAACLPRK